MTTFPNLVPPHELDLKSQKSQIGPKSKTEAKVGLLCESRNYFQGRKSFWFPAGGNIAVNIDDSFL